MVVYLAATVSVCPSRCPDKIVCYQFQTDGLGIWDPQVRVVLRNTLGLGFLISCIRESARGDSNCKVSQVSLLLQVWTQEVTVWSTRRTEWALRWVRPLRSWWFSSGCWPDEEVTLLAGETLKKECSTGIGMSCICSFLKAEALKLLDIPHLTESDLLCHFTP